MKVKEFNVMHSIIKRLNCNQVHRSFAFCCRPVVKFGSHGASVFKEDTRRMVTERLSSACSGLCLLVTGQTGVLCSSLTQQSLSKQMGRKAMSVFHVPSGPPLRECQP